MTHKRIINIIVVGFFILFFIGVIGAIFDSEDPEMVDTSESMAAAEPDDYSSGHTVPWDYKIQQAQVGDLIGGDMVILPDNQMLPNDQNYATGDQIWILQNMNAEMSSQDNGRTDIRLTAWKPIKSYKTQDDAKKDLKNLKEDVKTEVDLVGVYKTEYQGKYREFAALKLPTGNVVKQPVSEERYEKLKNVKKVAVILEQIHEYSDYDMVMSKFRGWAE